MRRARAALFAEAIEKWKSSPKAFDDYLVYFDALLGRHLPLQYLRAAQKIFTFAGATWGGKRFSSTHISEELSDEQCDRVREMLKNKIGPDHLEQLHGTTASECPWPKQGAAYVQRTDGEYLVAKHELNETTLTTKVVRTSPLPSLSSSLFRAVEREWTRA